jgi:hypothetical protein
MVVGVRRIVVYEGVKIDSDFAGIVAYKIIECYCLLYFLAFVYVGCALFAIYFILVARKVFWHG